MTYTIKDIKVFIPTYNRPNYLRQSIESLVTQSAGCPDITVYNNGTLKETSNVIKEFEKYGVKEVKSQGGLLECMVSVQEYVDSPYVMFFHDDDILNCKYLEYALKALNTYENISFITTKYNNFTNFCDIDFSPAKEEHYFFTSKKQFATNMYLYEKIAMQTAIYKTELFKKIPRESDKYGKFFDWPYLVTFAGLGNSVLFSDERIFNVRLHKGQWTNDEKSSWTIEQLVNWHNQFAKAMDIYSKESFEYYTFYSKFNYFISGGYNCLVCKKYQEECPLEDLLEYAHKEIGIDSQINIYDKRWIYLSLQNLAKEFNWRKDFGSEIIPERPITIEDIAFYKIQDLQNIVTLLLDKTSDIKKKPKYKNIFQWIFSSKNAPDKIHKNITIFGIRINIKRKNNSKNH